MSQESRTLPELKPIKFHSEKGATTLRPIEVKKTQSTKDVIAEIKKLSKKDIFPAQTSE